MSSKTDDLRIESIRSLISPGVLMESRTLSESTEDFIVQSRFSVSRILGGEDPRLLVVAGPCSIHDPKAALEYAGLLKEEAGRWKEQLFIVMRVYFEKPRTTVGWKGYINDPDMDGSYDINKGLHLARELLLQLGDMGVPAGTEFLDTIIPQYVADLVTWGAIGARTTESQIHRELASGLSMPVGFKNGTDGNIKIAVDAIKAASESHSFLSVTKQGVPAIVRTTGNGDCHVILRGSTKGPNHHADAIAGVEEGLTNANLPARIMVDCSHGNSRKDHALQPGVATDLAAQLSNGNKSIFGVMLESHLKAGNQSVSQDGSPDYGISITDACMDWPTTARVLEKLARSKE